jgi:hypothetical protein
MDKVLDNTDPTIQEVKEWGYDEEYIFIQQDEDLILHDSKYVSVLLELAADKNCPKTDYCFSILMHYTHLKLATRNSSELELIERNIQAYNGQLPQNIEKWKELFSYLYNFIKNPQTITESVAESIAYNLTVGDFSLRDFAKLGYIDSNVIEYLASTSSYKEYFYIDLRTSNWRSSKYSRLVKL